MNNNRKDYPTSPHKKKREEYNDLKKKKKIKEKNYFQLPFPRTASLGI